MLTLMLIIIIATNSDGTQIQMQTEKIEFRDLDSCLREAALLNSKIVMASCIDRRVNSD